MEQWDAYHPLSPDGFETEELRPGDVISPQVEVELLGGYVSSVKSDFEKFGEEPEPKPSSGETWGHGDTAAEVWCRAEEAVKQVSGTTVGNGLIPHWDFPTRFVLWQPQHAFVRIAVYNVRRGRLRTRDARTLLCYEVVPVSCLRPGYRSVQLRSPSGSLVRNCSLLVYINLKV